MSNFRIPEPKNEPVYSYAPGTPEREKLIKAIENLKSKQVDIPMVIGGKEVHTSQLGEWVMEALPDLDVVAYVRFASVYRQFKDVSEFMAELKHVLDKNKSDAGR